ncbi:MAG: chaperone ClpB, partial [Firmicutes bacterium]|nr:chaperone ClpB [Bacillota bacterium]
MQPTLCSKCQKNVAIVFITRMEPNGQTKNEGLCLKCAKELNIKPVTDMIDKMGMSEEDLDGLTKEMMTAFDGAEGMESLFENSADQDSEEDDEGRTATFPFLNKLMGTLHPSTSSNRPEEPAAELPSQDTGSRAERDDRTKKADQKQAKRKFLESYCISLTRRAAEGRLDRMIGRESELERVIQILNRRQKNNPCLIGEPGVGKTAIAEGLASKIQSGDVPYKLRDKEVYLLDLTSLVAGTQFRGQFESRMKGLIEEIRKLGNIILVIDEVHNLVGAGDAEGSMNAANILKPALSRGEIQVIGATTLTEYRKYIEKDSALERRFQPVMVNEPSIDESVEIIKGIAPYYEQFHHVTITPDIARLAVTMSERYITDRFLPDKAIDLIDEACSDVNLKNKSLARMAEVDKE